MKLEPLPKCLRSQFDDDSLIYEDDHEFYYNQGVSKELVNDIKNREFQVYTGYYTPKAFNKPQAKSRDYAPTIYLIGRGRKSGKVKVKVQNYFPYCYINEKDGEYRTYLGSPVKKLIFKCNPRAIKEFRDERRKRKRDDPLEADVPFVRRFLCDTYPYFQPKDYIKPKIAIFDVETNFPINDDIISFSINSGEEVYHNNIYKEKNKEKLILDLYERLKEYDVVTGWNVSFDIDRLEEELKKLLGYTKINHDVAIIDLLSTTKKMWARQIKGSWSLDNAGKQIAGEEKIDIDEYPRELSSEKLEKYNNQDVILPKKIDDIVGGIECHITLSWMAHCKLEDTEITTVLNDISMLRAYHHAGKVLPSKPSWGQKPDDDEPGYQAADPEARPGVYSNVVALDIKHAYPWAAQAVNATPETKDDNGKYQAPNGVRFNNGKSVFISTLDSLMEERAKAKANKKKYDEEGNDELFKKWKYIDFALKTQAAAFSHGEFGYWRSRMRDYRVAEAITQTTKNFIFYMMDKLEEVGFPWVYSHTDSIYVKCKKKDIDKLLKAVELIVDSYCEDKGYRKNAILEFEDFYYRVYIHSPARNVLIGKRKDIDNSDEWTNPPNKVTGMNFMRSETPEALAEIEQELIKLALKKKSKSVLWKRLVELIRNLDKYDSTELGIIKPLNKPVSEYGRTLQDGSLGGVPYHIKALLKARDEYGYDVGVGEKFMIIPVITNKVSGSRVIRREKVEIAYSIKTGLLKDYDIDYENYVKANLIGKISQFFEIDEDLLMETIREYIPNIEKCKEIIELAEEEIRKKKAKKKKNK